MSILGVAREARKLIIFFGKKGVRPEVALKHTVKVFPKGTTCEIAWMTSFSIWLNLASQYDFMSDYQE